MGSGNGTNADALISFSHDESTSYSVGLIIVSKAGVGLETVASRNSIPCFVVDEKDPWLRSEVICRLLKEHEIEMIALAGYLRQVSTEVIQLVDGNVLNVHPSLLPRFGGKGMYGLNVHRAVLENGEAVTGATVHKVSPIYDEGQILGQECLLVPNAVSVEQLSGLVLEIEHRLYPKLVNALAGELFSKKSVTL